jgi:2-octaprenylphenol hydroxylase
VALLPLADGRCSIVWSCFEAEARELAALSDDEFGARLSAATGNVLGKLRVTTRRMAFSLAARHTRRYTGARFALIGDAAHQIHPLAGQGINLGLLDAATLAHTLASHLLATPLADPGDALVLRRYERARKGDNLLTMAAMEGLHRVFTSDLAIHR